MFDLLVRVRNSFGAGQGLSIASGVIDYLLEHELVSKELLNSRKAQRAPCATRMVVYLSGLLER